MKEEALKLARNCIRDSIEYKQGKATAIEAVEDIEEALAQPQQEPDDLTVWRSRALQAEAVIDKFMAQPQQEPHFSVQQAYAMAQVCLDLHEALGCKWGDNPYLAIAGLREALKQALEALENSVDLVREDAYQAEKLYGNYPTRQGKINGLKVLADDHEKAITALEEALAQPVQEPVETYIHEYHSQPHPNDFGISKGHWWKAKQYADALYTTPPQRTNERVQAFQEIAAKIESMPFNDDTMASLVLWIKDQA